MALQVCHKHCGQSNMPLVTRHAEAKNKLMIGLDSEVEHLPVHVVFALFSKASSTSR